MDRVTPEMVQGASLDVLNLLEKSLVSLIDHPTAWDAFIFTQAVLAVCQKTTSMAFERLASKVESPDAGGK